MRFSDSGWLDVAKRVPGPSWKQSGRRPRTTGCVLHSSEGDLAGAHAVLQGPIQSSWPLTNRRDGVIEQHFPIQQLCWHARGGNSWSWGMEQIRRPGQTITPAQVNNCVDVPNAYGIWVRSHRYAGWEHWQVHRRIAPYKNLFEHTEITATLCPSDSIPWGPIVIRLRAPAAPPPPPPPETEDELSSTEAAAINKRLDGIINLLRLVGGAVQENTKATVLHGHQIDFHSTVLVDINKRVVKLEGRPAGDASDGLAELGSELAGLEDEVAENRARLIAAGDALLAGLRNGGGT